MKIKCVVTSKYEDLMLTNVELPIEDSIVANNMVIDLKTKYQSFIGFGGAFTEASGYNLSRVSENVKKEALKLYFSEEGLNYNLGRVAIGGCDFSLGSYAYIEENDMDLSSFSIEREKKYVFNIIKEAELISKSSIKILASPWSPPKWMKDNKSYCYGGKLLPEYYEIYAKYLIKYIKEARLANINIFAITLQNEPAAKQRWDSALYSPKEELDLLRIVGKLLEKEGLDDVKIYIWDHNRDIILERVEPIYQSDVSRYAYGTAVHWYDNEPFENLNQHHLLYPDKHLIHTEGCVEGGVKFNLYENGERYGRNIIGDFNNYIEGFIDWNLYLDETGGPNWVNNLCDAPIIIHVGQDRLIKEYSYYFIGQFSKYIKVNAKRVKLINESELLAVCYQNPDDSIVLVIQNEKEKDQKINLSILPNKNISFLSKKRSIMTLVIELNK